MEHRMPLGPDLDIGEAEVESWRDQSFQVQKAPTGAEPDLEVRRRKMLGSIAVVWHYYQLFRTLPIDRFNVTLAAFKLFAPALRQSASFHHPRLLSPALQRAASFHGPQALAAPNVQPQPDHWAPFATPAPIQVIPGVKQSSPGHIQTASEGPDGPHAPQVQQYRQNLPPELPTRPAMSSIQAARDAALRGYRKTVHAVRHPSQLFRKGFGGS
jgi:hypothetical protein